MRILSILLDNHIGGPQIRVLDVAKKLRVSGIDVTLVSPIGSGEFSKRAKDLDFKSFQIVLKVPNRSFISVLESIAIFPISVYKISKIIKNENIDIVHVNGLLSFQGSVAALITRRKIVWHLIGNLYPRYLVLALMPFVRLLADDMIFVANRLSDFYLNSPYLFTNGHINIVYECVDTEKFNPAAIVSSDITKLRREFNLREDEKVVGCIGNVFSVKGYEYFIKSACLIKMKYPLTKFFIVGDIYFYENNKYLDYLKDLLSKYNLSNSFIFTGKRNDIPKLVALFDVFVMSSLYEGTPLVILEAMAMQKAVVATNVGGIPEQIDDSVTGFLVPPKDANHLAEKIIYLLENPDICKKMGENGRSRVLKYFSLDRCAKEHIKIYAALLRN